MNNISGTLIGGYSDNSRNLISGNNSDGMTLYFSGSYIYNNYIGKDATGNNGIGNLSNGINIYGSNNFIGSTDKGNIIAYNLKDGVVVNYGTGNKILGNSIFSNGEEGIDLGSNGKNPKW